MEVSLREEGKEGLGTGIGVGEGGEVCHGSGRLCPDSPEEFRVVEAGSQALHGALGGAEAERCDGLQLAHHIPLTLQLATLQPNQQGREGGAGAAAG